MKQIVGGTRWNDYVKDYSQSHHIPYTEAIVDWGVSNAYRDIHNSNWNRKYNKWITTPRPERGRLTEEDIEEMEEEEVMDALREEVESDEEREDWKGMEEEDINRLTNEEVVEELIGITLEEMSNEEVVEELHDIAKELEEMAREDINRVKKKKEKEKATEEQLEEIEEEYEDLLEDADNFFYSKLKRVEVYLKWNIRAREFFMKNRKYKKQLRWEEMKKELKEIDLRNYDFVKDMDMDEVDPELLKKYYTKNKNLIL